jgi:hypothetical protein
LTAHAVEGRLSPSQKEPSMKRYLSLGFLLCAVVLAAGCKKKGFEGVAECDDFFKQANECKNTVEKANLTSSMDSMKAAWKEQDQASVKQECSDKAKALKDDCLPGVEGIAECDEYLKTAQNCKNEVMKKQAPITAKNNMDEYAKNGRKLAREQCKKAIEMVKSMCQ